MNRDLIVILGWLLATAIINALLRKRTVAEWEAIAEKHPRYAAFARLMRSVGLDPVKLAESFVDLVRGEARKRVGPLAVETQDAEKKSEEPKDGTSAQ